MTPRRSSRPAVVLVADRTLSADYRILFEGMFATMQTTHVPGALMRRLLAPRVHVDSEGRARTAVIGLRRMEASLLAEAGLSAGDVVVTTPEALPDLLGPWTRVVCVSSSDPLGRGMSNTTTASFWPGELYSRYWTRRMMEQVRDAKETHGFTVLAGGGGAWQWAADPEEAARQGIDCVFEGFFEDGGVELVRGVLDGQTPPAQVHAASAAVDRIRPIRRPSAMGLVELTRGCGKGCAFCSSGRAPMQAVPAETILADLETNVSGGIRSVVSGSEDFFRYGATGSRVSFEALAELLASMRQVEGLSFMQIDHANVSSVAQLRDEQLVEIRRLLTWERPSRYLWVNLGVESANGRLVAAQGAGKASPYRPEDWEELVRQVGAKLDRTGYLPVFSLVMGLPGETIEDVRRTLGLVRELSDRPCVVFPVFHEPVDPESAAGRFTLEQMSLEHLELYTTCYEINFRMVPRLIWDNQLAGGVPLAKRALMQALGRGEVMAWRRAFRKLRRRLRREQAGAVSIAG